MIVGERVGLRAIELEDLPLLAEWRNDPCTRPYFFTPFLVSRSGQRAWYEQLLGDRTRMQLMIVHLADQRPIGTVGLDHIDLDNQSAELGSAITAPDERGKHLGPAGSRLLVSHAFCDLNLRRVYARVLAFNTASLNAGRRVGFKHEGVARQAAFVNGQFHDVIYMAILREEWTG